MTESYDELEWDVGEMPVCSSTPDWCFELSYPATTTCPHCGDEISGTAQYWSRSEDFSNMWLERIDYEYCECQSEDELEEDDLDEEESESIINQKTETK